MKLRWQVSAVSDLANIRDYIATDSPSAARNVVNRVFRSVERLRMFPASGRLGQVPGTREVVVPGLPYIVVYTHDDVSVEVVAVFHGAQKRG